MKRTSLLILLILIVVSFKNETKPSYFQSEGNSFALELKQFAIEDEKQLSDLFDKKTYDFNLNQINESAKGHSYFIDRQDLKYRIQLTKVESSIDTTVVDFQVFINENGKERRIVNPGKFRIANTSDGALNIGRVKELLILLTFK